jgi:hypothetical protein
MINVLKQSDKKNIWSYKDEVNGLTRKLQIKKLRDLCSHLQENLRWTRHVSSSGETRMHTEFCWWKPLAKCPFGSPKGDWEKH